ncbi:MAG: FimB/Mfa2 family fimbrial subunit [Bacteroides sp.]|nr:FimB/Mfa2 family fimbrial subunit [Bacteroides sp.]
MRRIAVTLLALCAAICYCACSWVDDDQSDCPTCPTGTWLRLAYTLNMLDVDAASTQVTDASLFVLDAEGNLVERTDVDSLTLHGNDCMVRVPSLPEGNYTFLVWAGVEDSLYRYTPSSLTLLRDDAGEQSGQLPSLFHGRLDDVYVCDGYQVLTVPLTKDTNRLSCILQCLSTDTLSADDFRLELTSRNGCLDHRNQPVDTVTTCYLPFVQEGASVDGVQVVKAGMNTLRLLEDDDTRFRLTYLPGDYTLLDISLTSYLLLLRTMEAAAMEAQEYLDRQDTYSLIFFLTSTDDPHKPYICARIQVNGWVIRINDADLKK